MCLSPRDLVQKLILIVVPEYGFEYPCAFNREQGAAAQFLIVPRSRWMETESQGI